MCVLICSVAVSRHSRSSQPHNYQMLLFRKRSSELTGYCLFLSLSYNPSHFDPNFRISLNSFSNFDKICLQVSLLKYLILAKSLTGKKKKGNLLLERNKL